MKTMIGRAWKAKSRMLPKCYKWIITRLSGSGASHGHGCSYQLKLPQYCLSEPPQWIARAEKGSLLGHCRCHRRWAVLNQSKPGFSISFFYGSPAIVHGSPLPKIIGPGYPSYWPIAWSEFLGIKAKCFNEALSSITRLEKILQLNWLMQMTIRIASNK